MGVMNASKQHVLKLVKFSFVLPCIFVSQSALADTDQRLLEMCKACHGSDGSNEFSSIPNLKWQNQQYMVQQLQQFKSGQRQDKTMTKVAKLLSTEQMETMATYFSKGEEK